MTLIFKQTIKRCKDAHTDVKPGGGGGGGGGGGQTLCTCVLLVCMCTRMCVYACMCSYAKKNYEMHVYLFNRDVKYRFCDAVVKVLYLFPAHS